MEKEHVHCKSKIDVCSPSNKLSSFKLNYLKERTLTGSKEIKKKIIKAKTTCLYLVDKPIYVFLPSREKITDMINI